MELVSTLWHYKNSSPLHAKASYNNHQRAPAMPQSAQIRRWLPLNPIRQTNRQRVLEWARELRELAFYHRFKVALHTPLFSSISWVTVTEYLMRACGTRSSCGGADYTAPSKQHNTASTLHLMIPPELGRIARLPVLFLIGAFVLQWLAFSLRRIACVRGLSNLPQLRGWCNPHARGNQVNALTPSPRITLTLASVPVS